MPRPARAERMWRRRPLCFPRRTPGGRTSRRDAGRRRPVPQSPGTGVVAAGRPGAASAQARAWYETDTSSWARKPTSRTTVAPLASGLPRRCGPSRKGVVAWGWPRSLLPSGPPPPGPPTAARKGAWHGVPGAPATARTRRPAACDVPWPASAGRRRSDAAPSRVPGNRVSSRSGVSPVCRGPASPPVAPRLASVPGAAPADRLAGRRQAGRSLPRAQPHLHGLARPCPHRQTATSGRWNACTSRTVPREGPRVYSAAGFGPRRDDGTTNVMLQDGKPRRATGGGQPATADPATHCSYGARP